MQQLQETTTSDNRADIQPSVKSQEEQAKIVAQISLEETINLSYIKPKSEDAIYLEDTPAKALQKLLSLSECNFKEKVVYTKHLAELMSLFDDDGVLQIGNILKSILKESDEIKRSLITQLPQICNLLEKKQDGQKKIKDYVVPVVQTLLECSSIDIKKESGKEIVRIAKYLNEDDLGIYILKEVINMAHDELNEENKIVAVQLLGKLSETFGLSLTESFVVFEILSMGEDPKLMVRKEAVLQLANVGRVVSQSFFKQRFLPFFIKKCEEKPWQIRKACVDIIVDIANICSMADRENKMAEVMLNFLTHDDNRQVKVSAYKKLGIFISTLQGSTKLNDKLIDQFCKMTDAEIRDLEADKEILQVCAQNFPAVLITFGPNKWPQMQKLFQTLFKNQDKRIRKPLASSLHEIAAILGPQMANKELIPVLELVLKDTNDDIKYGAIDNLWQFLKNIEEDKREDLLEVFLILQKDQKKWRYRQLIAKQLHEVARIVSSDVVFKKIVPISMKLCSDTVSCVRRQAAKRISGLIESFNGSGNEVYQMCLIEYIKGFAESNRFNQRQTFVTMCSNLMCLESGIFENQLIELFVKLSTDKVKNVRLLVAKVLQKHLQKKGRLSSNESLLKIAEDFRSDQFISESLDFKFSTSTHSSPLKQVDDQKNQQKQSQENDAKHLNQSEVEVEVTDINRETNSQLNYIVEQSDKL